jgi:hypothetical protein
MRDIQRWRANCVAAVLVCISASLAAWFHEWPVGAQANRRGCAADHGGHDRQGTPDPWRRGSLAHTPGRVHGHLWHHVTRRYKSTPRRHPLPDRLQYEDDDGGCNRATGPGRQAESRRPSLEVCPGRAQRRQDHHHRAAEDAQRPLQLRRRPRVLGDPRA